MNVTAFPKIFAIGTDYIRDIFLEDVEITEKVDGSQFVFGKIKGEVSMRSKGCIQYAEKYDKMFTEAVEYVKVIEHLIPDNTIFYCEYLQSPKHNTLCYERTPKNWLCLFGIAGIDQKFNDKYEVLVEWANKLDIDVVPLLYRGKVSNIAELEKLLETDSYLGKSKIEGFVVKNYYRPFLLGGQPIPIMAGKYVSEAFKEVHRAGWTSENTGIGKWQTFKDSFRTEARWEKAIQHLKEKGEYTGTPRDIGKLLKEIQEDIKAEEIETIKAFLWKEFGQEVLRNACGGFPEWFKKKLMSESNFGNELTEGVENGQ
jgi:hypothetical protein